MKNNIYDPYIIDHVKEKLNVPVALGGRRALALVGITFRRPILISDDHDLVIKSMPFKNRFFDSTFSKAVDDLYDTDEEKLEGLGHYFFNTVNIDHDTIRNCLFVHKDVITTMHKGILIVDPEQILYFKKKYIVTSPKHREDFENMNSLVYNLKHL